QSQKQDHSFKAYLDQLHEPVYFQSITSKQKGGIPLCTLETGNQQQHKDKYNIAVNPTFKEKKTERHGSHGDVLSRLVPRTFSGDDDIIDIKEWLNEVAAWITLNNMNVHQAMAGIRFLLRSEARIFFDELEEAKKENFDKFKIEFINRYQRDSAHWKRFNRFL